MKRLWKSKLILLAILGILAFDLANDFPLVDIKETAIVVAIGLDREGEDYEVSAQIAVPQATDQAAMYKASVISGKGRTPALALENIGTHTGWYIKLSFCNVIFLGKSILEDDVMECIDYFIRTDRINDTVELCAADGAAKEIITATAALDDVSAFSVLKILERDAESASTVSFMNLKEFAMGYYSPSGFSLMPKIKVEPAVKPESGNGTDSGGQEENSGQGENSGGKKDEKIFNANTTVLFNKGKAAGELDEERTLLFNLVRHRTSESSVLLHDSDFYGHEADLMISLRDNKWRYDLKLENGRPVLDVYLTAKARIDDTNVIVPPHTLATSYTVPDNVLKDLEEKIESGLIGIFEECRDNDCDVFCIRERLYRTQNRYYEGYKDIVLQNAGVRVKAEAKSYK
ncbi:MAG: hypothetical protein J6Z34_00140 [Clostridia bacterium]|nr:hypothetical protein [Clostridia bacterium]